MQKKIKTDFDKFDKSTQPTKITKGQIPKRDNSCKLKSISRKSFHSFIMHTPISIFKSVANILDKSNNRGQHYPHVKLWNYWSVL